MQVPSTLTVGLSSNDEAYRALLEAAVKTAATACGVSLRMLSTPCWDLLDTVSAQGIKPDLLLFHNGAVSRAVESSARFICQRYRPVRITFLGSRIADGTKTLTLRKTGEEIVLYTSLRNSEDWAAIGASLTRDIRWVLEHSDLARPQPQSQAQNNPQPRAQRA